MTHHPFLLFATALTLLTAPLPAGAATPRTTAPSDTLRALRHGDIDSVAIVIPVLTAGDGDKAVRTVMARLDTILGGSWTGDPVAAPAAMIAYYADSLHQSLLHHPNAPFVRREKLGLFRGLTMEKAADTETYLTVTVTQESYDGGAHGLTTTEGLTVRKSDGSPVGQEALRPLRDRQCRMRFNRILRRHLQSALGAATDDELSAMLLTDSLLIPLPHTPPYITPDGLHLIWQPYEIAPYAAGILHVVLPPREAMPFIGPEARRLLQTP